MEWFSARALQGLRRCLAVLGEMPLTLSFLTLAIGADDLSTAIALANGGAAESNPLSNAILGLGAGWLYGVKLAAVPLVIGLVSAFEPAERRFLRWVILAGAIALFAISAHNLTTG